MKSTPRDPPAPPADPPVDLPAGAAGAASMAPRRISSSQLFGHGTEVHIEHHGAIYRLRQTALGKLILTK